MRPITTQLLFTLAVLFGINTMNFYDRQVLPAVQEAIRKDWQLDNKHFGALGTAFILLYAVVGLPLGRVADLWQRRWILAVGVALWSVFTFLSGLAQGFWSLFVLRLGVGIGEASCAPAASSLIGDLFPPNHRARAMSIFMLGLPIGLALSYLVSAEIASRYGWREAFFVAGVPGLILAVAALFLTEPPRPLQSVQTPPFFQSVRQVLVPPTMWWIILSGALHNFNMYALGTFLASYLKLYHGVSIAQAGRISALTYGFGALGIFVSGWFGDRAFRRHRSGRLRVAWISLALAIPFLLLALAAPEGQVWLCALWLLLGCFLLYAYYGTIYAAIQDIIAPQMRGMAMAVYFCAMYFLGAVLGPIATGVLSDYFAQRAETLGVLSETMQSRAEAGEDLKSLYTGIGLHDTMFVVPILTALLVGVLYLASRTVSADIERLQQSTTSASPHS